MRLAVATVLIALGLASAAPARTLVAYDRSGGFVGESTQLKVSGSGRATLTSDTAQGRTFTLSDKQLRGLRRALREARFETLREVYRPDGVVSDGFTESVAHAGRTVTTSTGAEHPARFERVLSRLRRLTQ